jgi:signal transduction histidine kinase
MYKMLRSKAGLFAGGVVVPVLLVMFLLPGVSGSIFSTGGFMPHAHCYLNDPRVVWLHVLSDISIGAAYVAISSMLGYLVFKARHDIPFQWMFLAFGLFIISCGMTHFMEVWTVWRPTYWLSGDIKMVTAVASVATAVALPPLIPKIFALIQTAKASEERKIKLESAHREMEQMNKELRKLDELKSQFFANVSHELRTPLALILGPTEKLLSDHDLKGDQKRDLEVVSRNARLLLKHVNDLLDASKLDAGRMGIRYAEVDLTKLCRLTASHFEILARDRHIAFVVETAPELSAQVDAEKLERIWINLLANAFKFTPDRGRIRMAVRAGNGEVMTEVSDSGPGVPIESRAIIFERFRQADGASTRQFGGTGLGLSITKDFVEMHRGTIEVGDAAEGGALFTVRLPVRAPAGVMVESRTGASEMAPELIRPELEGLRPNVARRAPVPGPPLSESRIPTVLVVEDNLEMNEFICETLEGQFCTASAAEGYEGLSKARAIRPDLILTDVMMPGMSGDQLVEALRADNSFEGVPILVVTAKADDELRNRLLREGAQDCLTKPFSADELRARVRNLILARLSRIALQKANEELEAFSYSISHDMRGPLRAMHGYAEIVLSECGQQLSQDGNDLLQRIMNASRRMDTLIRDVLSYSRVARGDIRLGTVDADKLVQEIVGQDPALQPPKAEVSVQSPLGRVKAHEAMLSQCLTNLLGNAVKFVPANAQPRVRVWSERVDSEVRIWVEDNGIGIPERDCERIFDMLVQVHGSVEYEGTGIGLAIVRKAMERMGGSVGVQSEEGRGSRFWLKLPGAEDGEPAVRVERA